MFRVEVSYAYASAGQYSLEGNPASFTTVLSGRRGKSQFCSNFEYGREPFSSVLGALLILPEMLRRNYRTVKLWKLWDIFPPRTSARKLIKAKTFLSFLPHCSLPPLATKMSSSFDLSFSEMTKLMHISYEEADQLAENATKPLCMVSG